MSAQKNRLPKPKHAKPNITPPAQGGHNSGTLLTNRAKLPQTSKSGSESSTVDLLQALLKVLEQ